MTLEEAVDALNRHSYRDDPWQVHTWSRRAVGASLTILTEFEAIAVAEKLERDADPINALLECARAFPLEMEFVHGLIARLIKGEKP